MKECPRCGSGLSHYSLSDVEAYGCDSCGWVGVMVEHKSKPVELESWNDAISRFYTKFSEEGHLEAAEKLAQVNAEHRSADSDDETDTEEVEASEGDEAVDTDNSDEATDNDETVETEEAPDHDDSDETVDSDDEPEADREPGEEVDSTDSEAQEPAEVREPEAAAPDGRAE
jgi:hypothetical protein